MKEITDLLRPKVTYSNNYLYLIGSPGFDTVIVNNDTILIDQDQLILFKYSLEGQLIWYKSIYGSIDIFELNSNNGHLYFYGAIRESIYLSANDSITPSDSVLYLAPGYEKNGFVSSLDSDGNLEWHLVLESYRSNIQSISFDNQNNLKILGLYKEFYKFGQIESVSNSLRQSIILNVDENGQSNSSFEWDSEVVHLEQIVLDNESVILSGRFNDYFELGPFGDSLQRGRDYILTKLSLPVNVEESSPNHSCLMYPNPAKDYFITSLDNNEKAELKVLDITGKVVFQETFSKETNISTAKFKEGIYFLKVKNNGNVITRKFIVE